MRWIMSGLAILAGVMGLTTVAVAVAGNGGPIVMHIVLAQAVAPGAGVTPQPDFILKDCQEIETTNGTITAMNGVDPAGALAVYIGNRDERVIFSNPAAMAAIKITLLEGTTHGELVSKTGGKLGAERLYFMYDSEPDYKGNDRAVFMAEFEGKRYKIVIEIHVVVYVSGYDETCPKTQLIKVKK